MILPLNNDYEQQTSTFVQLMQKANFKNKNKMRFKRK